ncbi:MAG: class I SAM-dependent methyltransferase [Nannocystaceae bacterium]|nr:class I SAM-dependent methyltransferase [Nannocystaceae bacterium]
MSDAVSHAQAEIYRSQAEAYDELIAAEDADGNLRAALEQQLQFAGKRVVDIGAGTGRIARWVAGVASHVTLLDQAAAMLEVARQRLQADGHLDRATIVVADARTLPLPDGCADVAVAGWVFGHFRGWMADTWRDEVDRAVAEMARVVVPGGMHTIIDTLGTGHETPRVNAELDEYFDHLCAAHGFARSWVRSDYVFADVDTAARVSGTFFGDRLAAQVRENNWHRIPECTAILTRTR